MKSHATPPYTFKQLNDEFSDFYKYLKDNKYSDEEIRKIFAPLAPDLKKTKLAAAILLTSVAIIAILYFATYAETVFWHFSALGRILLIKLLPFWDWTRLKNQKCLLPKPSAPMEEPRFNCDLCEHIQQIDVYEDISGAILKNKYLDVDVPVIIKKSWPKLNLEDVLKNDEIADSTPCSLATNIYNGVATIKNLLIKTRIFDSFFLHFQNCDFRAMKQFRGFTPRPTFLPPELSPVQYNWLLWSKNYNVTQFKAIGLVERVAVVGQINGANLIRLVPSHCEGECPVIELTLKGGESVIFTGLWNLQYRPDLGENVAVILEMH